jgi:hypothetical protein
MRQTARALVLGAALLLAAASSSKGKEGAEADEGPSKDAVVKDLRKTFPAINFSASGTEKTPALFVSYPDGPCEGFVEKTILGGKFERNAKAAGFAIIACDTGGTWSLR